MQITKKELILQATLSLIKREGFEGITIRKIASEAEVNVGLVNYYFGSKDKLINEVIQILATSLKDTFALLDDKTVAPKDRLKQFLIQYVTIYQQYPFIGLKILSQGTLLFESQRDFVTFIKAIGLRKMHHTIQEITGESDSEKITIMMSHLLGATFLPTLMEPLFEKVTGLPLPDMEKRIDLMLERYFS